MSPSSINKMSRIISQTVPDYFQIRGELLLSEPAIEFGFNADVELNLSTEHYQQSGTNKSSRMVNAFTLLADYTSYIHDDRSILDGIRKDVFNAQGEIDAGMISKMFMKTCLSGSEAMELAQLAADNMHKRNLVGLFYNLIRLYYLEKLHTVIYNPEAVFFENGNFKIINKHVFLHMDEEKSTRESVTFDPAEHKPLAETIDYEDKALHLLWWGRVSAEQLGVITRALGAFTCKAPFTVAHTSPRLARDFTLHARKVPAKVAKYDKSQVLSVISNLVCANNAKTDFAYAYMMVAQMLLAPIPRTAEGMAWAINPNSIAIPNVYNEPAKYPFMYSNNQYCLDHSLTSTFADFMANPDIVLIHSAGLVECATVELGLVIQAQCSIGEAISDFQKASTNGVTFDKGGILSDLSFMATRLGVIVDLPYETSSGLDRVSSVINPVNYLQSVIVTDSDAAHKLYDDAMTRIHGSIKVDTMARLKLQLHIPPLYPIFSYGINPSMEFGDMMEASVTVTPNVNHRGQFAFDDVRKFVEFMNIMIMLGYDLKAGQMASDIIITNSSDTRTGRFTWYQLEPEFRPPYEADFYSAHKRELCYIDLDDIEDGTVLSYKMSNFRVTMSSGGSPVGKLGSLIRKPEPLDQQKLGVKIQRITPEVRIIPLKRNTIQGIRYGRYCVPTLSVDKICLSSHLTTPTSVNATDI